MADRPKVVIIGAGFGGLTAAREVSRLPVDVTVLDRKNHHRAGVVDDIAAGAHPGGQIGHSTLGSHLLTKVACEAMVGKRPHVSVFGSDYPTPDGTGVRDYLHIEDLAAAHRDALTYLRGGGKSTTLNVGYGHGYSVREVLRMVESVAGKPLNIREEARRAGDPAYLVAHAERIRSELNWRPRYDDLNAIVSSSLAWEEKLLKEPWD